MNGLFVAGDKVNVLYGIKTESRRLDPRSIWKVLQTSLHQKHENANANVDQRRPNNDLEQTVQPHPRDPVLAAWDIRRP